MCLSGSSVHFTSDTLLRTVLFWHQNFRITTINVLDSLHSIKVLSLLSSVFNLFSSSNKKTIKPTQMARQVMSLTYLHVFLFHTND